MSRGDAVRLRKALARLHPDLEVRAIDLGIVRGFAVAVEATVAALDHLERIQAVTTLDPEEKPQ